MIAPPMPATIAGREVDLAEQQHEHLADREQAEDRGLHEQVDEVAGGQEVRVRATGTGSRSGAARRRPGRTPLSPPLIRAIDVRRYSPADPATISGGTAISALRAASLGQLVGVAAVRAWARRPWTPSALPAGLRPRRGHPIGAPVVIRSTTICAVELGLRAAGRRCWPRRSTAIRSATSKTSFMLCETIIAARPRSASRRTSASTIASGRRRARPSARP